MLGLWAMNKKIDLIINPEDFTSVHSAYLEPIWKQYFNILHFVPNTKFSNKSIIVSSYYNKDLWYRDLDGKLVIDNLWERVSSKNNRPCHTWYNKNWYWYNESLWYSSLGYDVYKPIKTYKKLALMPMRLPHIHRALLLDRMQPFLDEFIYSYNSKGIFLPDDEQDSGHWQRYFNPMWYNDTYFSVVAESTVDSGDLVLTEKIFKPMAYYHPFIVLSQPGILDYLKSQGFETFNNLFDESYDGQFDLSTRIDILFNNVKNFSRTPYDNLTLGKINHNRNLFFNSELIIQRIYKEIIEPTLEYAES